MALFRNTTENAKRSTSFGSEQAQRPHSVGRELNDLREDVENAFSKIEAQTSIPVILCGDLQYKRGDKQTNAACELEGVNFLAGQVQASATINKLTFTSTYPGTAGNSLNVTVVDGVGNGVDLSVAVANGTDITITLGTGGAGALDAAKNTNTLIIAEVASECTNIATAALAAGGVAGNSDLVATAKTLLSGGTGDGATLRAHQLGQDPVAIAVSTFSDTNISILVDVGTLTATPEITDVIGIVLESNRAKSNPFHAVTLA
jgi:hypothetical protein